LAADLLLVPAVALYGAEPASFAHGPGAAEELRVHHELPDFLAGLEAAGPGRHRRSTSHGNGPAAIERTSAR